MLHSLKLSNFQGHRKTKLYFGSGVNIIKGLPDSGKTSIFRALYWLVFNKPVSAKEYISHWGGPTKVKAKFDDCVIERVKGNGKNTYSLDGKVFKAVGREVPDEIRNAINMTEENFQMQHDPLFLFSKSSREVAKFLNSITNLDMIDSSLQYLETNRRSTLREIEFVEGALEDVKKKKSKLTWIPLVTGYVSTISQTLSEIRHLRKRSEALEECTSNIENVKCKLGKYQELDGLEKTVRELEKLIGETTMLEEKADRIVNTVESINEMEHKIEKCSHSLREKEELYHKLFPSICPLCGQKIKKERR